MTVSAPSIRIRDRAPDDRDWADALISAHQGSRMTARLGELLDPLELDGLVDHPLGVIGGEELCQRGALRDHGRRRAPDGRRPCRAHQQAPPADARRG